ncbi:MAG TPA: glucose-6-phosphate dehydrogenase [Clostridia bacterium]|nr:glucose-6-phosphate dehydrogenase [Clostridia bacterium]
MMETIDARQHPGPAIVIIFGGAGDLAWRKLIPSLFTLHLNCALPDQFAIIAVDKGALSNDTLRKRLKEGVRRFPNLGPYKATDWKTFASHISYQRGDLGATGTYTTLAKALEALDKSWNAKPVRVFHLATPPSLIGIISKSLSTAGLANDRHRARIVVEKPIGSDLKSARGLNHALTKYFDESQVFRIDHYLGKETVQNILAFRFANPMFEPIWNRRYVDYLTITVAEEVGVGHRGKYYDHAGELRDMVQNHLMQLVCLVAMEPPVSFNADEIRDKKVAVLRALRPFSEETARTHTVRGQYGPGSVAGKRVRGYREEQDVVPDSVTETYVAMQLFVDNWRWQDVPFYLRAGKRMPRQLTEIVIHFRPVPHRLFPPDAVRDWQPTRVIMSIQPEEGIVLRCYAKQPGSPIRLRQVDMRFNYREAFNTPSPPAYATLLHDVMVNDATLFMRSDQVEEAWGALMPLLKAWATAPAQDFPNYASGTDGPGSAKELIERAGHGWDPIA